MAFGNLKARIVFSLIAVSLAMASCAAPSPTATPTRPPAAAMTPTPAPTATPTKRPLIKGVIAYVGNNLANLAPLLARAKGYWQEEGLDMDWVVSGGGAKALAAVVGGSADFSLNAFVPEVIKAIDAGQPIKAIAVSSQRGPYFLVLNKDIASQRGVSQKSSLAEKGKALKGLTIAAFSAGGATYQLLKVVLTEGGLDPERDVNVTFIGDDAALPVAMEKGQIDGFFHAAPATAQPVAGGYGVTLVNVPAGDMPILGNQPHLGMLAQQQTISGKPELVDAAVRAIWRSQRFFYQDPAAAAKALRTLDFFAALDERTFNTSIDTLKEGFVAKDPIMTAEQFNDGVRYYNSTVKAEEQTKITIQQLFDDGPAQRAKKQLGF